tara:strand:+ start:2978 stop:3451 length:474 start_codon:yes stop_codon:yes gene_type:complete
MVGCLPCAAAAGPPGIAVAAVGTVGYGVYKYSKPKKKIKKKKLTKKKKKGGGKGSRKFKRNEIVRFKSKTGKNINMKFARYLDKNMATLRFMNKKGTITINLDRVEKMPKRIVNTKLRQKTRRANLVRKKRGIKSKSSTVSLPSSENVDDLLKDMKL